jgi:hypothetical protein
MLRGTTVGGVWEAPQYHTRGASLLVLQKNNRRSTTQFCRLRLCVNAVKSRVHGGDNSGHTRESTPPIRIQNLKKLWQEQTPKLQVLNH